jgi:uncharacterized membrane protein YedE/YeeE
MKTNRFLSAVSAVAIIGASSFARRAFNEFVSFGIGWGLVGFCPGPAIVSAGAGQPKAIVFVIAMLAGMWLFELAERMSRRTPSTRTGAR